MRLPWTLSIGLAALVLTGCTNSPPSNAPPASAPLSNAVLLVAPTAAPGTGAGAAAAGQRPLGLSKKGCVTVGDAVLYAPAGSSITTDARHIRLARIGDYVLGETLPIVQGTVQTFSANNLPDVFRRCGPGKYTVIIEPV